MGLRFTLLAAVVLAVLVAWTLYLGTGAVQEISWSLGFASIALAVTSWYAWRVRDHASKKYFDLDAESDRLANAVRAQYERELRSRAIYDPYPIPMTWRQATHAVTGSKTRAGRQSVRGEAQNLVDLFGTLSSSRLVILGEPGAGKTTLAIKFVASFLDARMPGQPVPVMFSLAQWDPAEMPLPEWLTGQLIEAYPALGQAGAHARQLGAEMVGGQHILPVLDGLDEMPLGRAAKAIDQLNKLMIPFVLTSRLREYGEITAESRITAATQVILEPLSVAVAIEYLQDTIVRHGQHTEAWRNLFDVLRSGVTDSQTQAVRDCLNSPFFLDLIRRVYIDSARNPDELLSFNTEELRKHLLEAVIPSAFAQHLWAIERGPYHAGDAEAWLQFIATHMHQMARPEFRWWDLVAAVPRWQLAVVASLIVGTVSALSLSVLLGVGTGLLIAAVSTVAAFLAGRYLLAVDIDPPVSPGTPGSARAIAWWTVPVGSIPLACGAAFVAGTGAGLAVGSLLAVMIAGLSLVSRLPTSIPAVTPERDISRNRAVAVMEWATLSVVVLVVSVLAAWGFGVRHWALTAAVEAVSVCLLWLILGTAWGRYVAARVWLALRGRLPWRLASFLALAWQLGVMRRAGPTYQFRHVSLQEALARRPDVAAPAWEQMISRD